MIKLTKTNYSISLLTILFSLFATSVYSDDIVFTSSSRITGDQVFLYFNGYGSTYARVTGNYTVSVETDGATSSTIRVQDAAADYLYCILSPSVSSGQKTTVTLTYSNGDCGKVIFNGTAFSSTESCNTPVPSSVKIESDLTETYAFRGAEVKLTAVGFDEGVSYLWESAANESGPWETISGTTSTVTVYPLVAGSNFYRVTALAGGVQATASITILAKVSCNVSGSAGQQVIWKETFDETPFTTPTQDRHQCKWVKGYTFATWKNTCAAEEGKTGKVCDGYYVVVANSTAAYPSACGWPEGKFDHTSGNGTSGFLIINAGEPKKIMYEQTITPETGFCSGVYYNFSLYATNIASATWRPARFDFDIVEIKSDGSEIYLVKGHDSGAIEGSSMEKWYEYGVSFIPQDIENLKQVVVRIWNTGNTNDGNDVVIDDISVSICKPTAAAFIGTPSDKKKEESDVSCGTAVDLNAVVNGYMGDFFPNEPYYLWQKQLSGSTQWNEVMDTHSKTYSYTTDPSEVAKFRCVIASDEATARLAVSGQTETGCGTYAWTDTLSVKCNDNCDNPASVTWVSTSGSQTQSVCGGTAIVDMKFQLGGSATGFTIEGLPSGLSVSPEPGATTQSEITVSGIPTANGTFKITTAGQQYPCTAATISGTVAVNENPDCKCPSMSAPTGKSSQYCEGSEASALVITSEVGADYKILWYDAENYKVSEGVSYTPSEPGVYTAKLSYTKKDGCLSAGTQLTQTKNEIPSVSVSAEESALTCVKQSVEVKAVADGGSHTGYSYSWNAGEYTPSSTYSAIVAGDYGVRVKDSNGCVSASRSITITDEREFTDIKMNTTFPYGSSTDNYMLGAGEVVMDVETVSGVNPYQIDWYVNDKLVQSSDNVEFTTVPYTDSKVKVVAYSICNADGDEVDIKVVWPTVVTPYARDGFNDDFVIGTGIEIRLFDRNGNMMYHGYDGVPADVLMNLQPSVYYYQAVLPDGNVRKSTLEVFQK